jgi:hypothetical protein
VEGSRRCRRSTDPRTECFRGPPNLTNPKKLAPPVTRPWGRTPVRAVVDGLSWDTSVWRDTKTDRVLLAVPVRIRGNKGAGDTVTVEFTFDAEEG